MDSHGQVRPPTHESVPEVPISRDQIDRLINAIHDLTRDVQEIVREYHQEQEDIREDASRRILNRKFRKALHSHYSKEK